MPRPRGSRNIIPTVKEKRMIVNELTKQALAGNPISAGVFLELDRRGYFNSLTKEDKKMKKYFNPMQGAKETSLRKPEPDMPKQDAGNAELRKSNDHLGHVKEHVVDQSGAKSE